jgi:tripartite-type tricarboxylate transporter receptor subunit TctC
MVRSGTPPELVIRLNQAVNKALNTDGMRSGFAKIGAEPIGGSPEEFGKLVRSQIEHWGKVIKAAGMQ